MMNKEIGQLTVTSIPETIESDASNRKDGQYWILESKNEISTTEDLYKGLMLGLKSNCNIRNNSEINEKLKKILISRSPNEDHFFRSEVEEPNVLEDTTEEDILEILEKSRELKKENLQKIGNEEILLSGEGGKPFLRLESKEKQLESDDQETSESLRESIANELDRLLISTLKCVVEVERLGEINSCANIRHNLNSPVSQNIQEMRDLITDLFIDSFNRRRTR